MEFKLTIGFNADTLNRIDAFLKAINAETFTAPAKEVKKEAKVANMTTEKVVVEAPSTNGKAVVITLEDLRKLTKEKSEKSKEMKAKVLAVVKKYAPSLSEIPEDQYNEYHNELIQL